MAMKINIILILLLSSFLVFCSQHSKKENSEKPDKASVSVTNGNQIYFNATSNRGTKISYTGGPMMGMMGRNSLACASCHGSDAHGGRISMHMMELDVPDIRWSSLSGGHHHEEMAEEKEQGHHDEYDFNDFKNSVENGRHPDGDALSTFMPRWKMSDVDLKDLMEYLKSLK